MSFFLIRSFAQKGILKIPNLKAIFASCYLTGVRLMPISQYLNFLQMLLFSSWSLLSTRIQSLSWPTLYTANLTSASCSGSLRVGGCLSWRKGSRTAPYINIQSVLLISAPPQPFAFRGTWHLGPPKTICSFTVATASFLTAI